MSGGIDRDGGAVEQSSWAACRAGIEGETGAGFTEHLGGAEWAEAFAEAVLVIAVPARPLRVQDAA